MNRREFLSKMGLAIPAIIIASSEVGRTQEKNREYPVPVEGQKIELKDANFTIFPEKLDFNLGKMTLVVSTFWQTAALYNADGTRYYIDGDKNKPFFTQVGTGKPDTPTRFGIWELQTQKGSEHTSSEHKGARMPWAMHMGEVYINEKGELESKRHTGVAIHGRETVQDDSTVSFMSYGCIGVRQIIAKFLQKVLKKNDMRDGQEKRNFKEFGDYIIVIGEKMPEIESKDPRDLLRFLKKQQGTIPKVQKAPEKIRTEKWYWQNYGEPKN